MDFFDVLDDRALEKRVDENDEKRQHSGQSYCRRVTSSPAVISTTAAAAASLHDIRNNHLNGINGSVPSNLGREMP